MERCGSLCQRCGGGGLAGGYSLLVVTGRCRTILLNSAWLDSAARITVDLTGWDGSDVFAGADGATGFIALTERAAAVFRGFQGARAALAQSVQA